MHHGGEYYPPPQPPAAPAASGVFASLGAHRTALALAVAAFLIIMYAMPKLHSLMPGVLSTKVAWAGTAAALIALAFALGRGYLDK